jgi:DNA-binding winged helix-turn-helix (wHTH) protein/Tol biopolymer transport system component
MYRQYRYLQFREFTLDREEKRLFRAGEPVQLTPKAFGLLLELVDNAGKVIDKDELLSSVWGDTFVEEGNVAFTIRLIRRALGDSPREPQFIETLPRRGYRFIADISVKQEDTETTNRSPVSRDDPEVRRPVYRVAMATMYLLILLVGLVIISGWPFTGERGKTVSILRSPFSSERLSTDGNVSHAVIASSGDFVVYVEGTLNEKQSIRSRDIRTGQTREILGSMNQWYIGLAISPDDNSVFFVRKPSVNSNESCLFKTSINGGIPEEVTCGVQGWISVSPNGQKISFVRCDYREDSYCSLFVADVDGANEQLLVSRPAPFRIGDSAFSPDNQRLAFASGQSRDGRDDFGIFVVDLVTKLESPATLEKFFNVKRLLWLADGTTLLATALKSYEEITYFWQINIGSGEAIPIKRDSESYNGLSIDISGTTIVSTVVQPDFRLFVGRLANNTPLGRSWRAITPHFMSDGRILYASDRAGQTGIWLSDTDGTINQQLSTGSMDLSPILSPNGKAVYFASTRSGKVAIWEMNVDGSRPRQVTSEQGGWPKAVTEDGEWIYYVSAFDNYLSRTNISGTIDEQITNRATPGIELSSDGKLAAYIDRTVSDLLIVVTSLPEFSLISKYKLPGPEYSPVHLAWSSNKSAFYAILYEQLHNRTSIWKQELGQRKMVKLRELEIKNFGERSDFVVSPNADLFAVVYGDWKHDAILLRGLN